MKPRLLLDLDGTLIERDYSRIAPAPWLERILAIGLPMAICSNQGGIAWNLAGGRPGKSYPDWPGIVARVAAGMRLAGVRLAFVSLYHPEASIPSGNLLWERGRAIGLPSILIQAIGYGNGLAAIVPAEDAGFILASWSPKWRKPSPGMLVAARRLLDPARRFSWCYVGDEEDDGIAATRAAMDFVDVQRYR